MQENKFFNLAGIISTREIRYFITPSTNLTSLDDVKVYCGGKQVPVESISSLNNKVITGVITVSEEIDISQPYEVEIKGYGRQPALPTDIFDSAEFIENYTYDGNDLGVTIDNGMVTFKLCRPPRASFSISSPRATESTHTRT